MEEFVVAIQTLGFPIACVIGLAFFVYKFVIRIQDESKAREDKLMSIISEYGMKMGEITNALERINGRLLEIEEKV